MTARETAREAIARARAEGRVPRVAIVRLGAIGDVVNTLPLLCALRDGLDPVHLTWFVEPKARAMVEGHAALDALEVFPRHEWRRQLRAFAARARAGRFDVVLDTQRLLKSALVARATGCPVRVGFDRARSKEGNWLWCTEHLEPGERPGVMVAQFLEFARPLGVEPGPPRWDLPVGDGARAEARDLLEGTRRPFVVVNLGASKVENLWPAERFAALTRGLRDGHGVEVIWTGGEQDRPRAREAARHAGPDRDLVGATGLKTLAAVLAEASLVVACDTGPLHLAVAMGRPVVALFGPADPSRTGPFGQPEAVVRPASHRMEDLAVDAVLERVASRLPVTP